MNRARECRFRIPASATIPSGLCDWALLRDEGTTEAGSALSIYRVKGTLQWNASWNAFVASFEPSLGARGVGGCKRFRPSFFFLFLFFYLLLRRFGRCVVFDIAFLSGTFDVGVDGGCSGVGANGASCFLLLPICCRWRFLCSFLSFFCGEFVESRLRHPRSTCVLFVVFISPSWFCRSFRHP